MGCSPFKRSCHTNTEVTAPNPSPTRWKLLDKLEFKNSYVLLVKYLDCTNFEGHKILVYKGKYRMRLILDPHFSEDVDAPVARFKPDEQGRKWAIEFAKSI